MATANIYDLADTWNDAGTTFTAIKMNVTDTSSASGSLLMDLQVSGTSYFNIAKSGAVYLNSQGFVVSTTTTAGAATRRLVASNGLYNVSTNDIYWSDNTTDVVPIDLQIGRKGTANLRLGAADAAAPAAQTLSVQGGSGTNIAGQDFTIQGSQSTGSAAGGSILFQVSPAGGAGSGQNGFETIFQITGSGGITGQDGTTANTLALRNGANAQTFNIYNTFTDASNYERGELVWNSNTFTLRTTAVGTGAARDLNIVSGSSLLGLGAGGGTPTWYITPTQLAAGADSSVIVLGATSDTGLSRASAGVLKVTDGSTGFGSLQLGTTSDALKVGTHTAIGAETVTGYITIKDSAGNDRKIAVVS